MASREKPTDIVSRLRARAHQAKPAEPKPKAKARGKRRKRRIGRPTLCLDPTIVSNLIKSAQVGADLDEAARAAGIGPSTLDEWISKGKQGLKPYAEFYRKFDQEAAQVIVMVGGALAQAALSGDSNAAHRFMWWKSKNYREAHQAQKLELSGKNGGPIELKQQQDAARESLLLKLADAAKKITPPNGKSNGAAATNGAGKEAP